MGYCLRVDDYHHIDDESDCGESTNTKKMALGMHRKFWQWGREWISAKKASLYRGLMMEDDEALVGCCRISWRHLFWKIRAEVRRMIQPREAQRFGYDAISYSQNFDDGNYENSPDCDFSTENPV
ncbi:hypothetical protein SUGI_0709180 [Cryptomeria japonica]|nr:hypothetical protein SUGI_0709180 [Cryptomeria japonica]